MKTSTSEKLGEGWTNVCPYLFCYSLCESLSIYKIAETDTMNSPMKLRCDDWRGIGRLLLKNGLPDDEEFLKSVVARAYTDPDDDLYIHPHDLLLAANRLKQNEITRDMYEALVEARSLGDINDDTEAPYLRQLQQLQQQEAQIANDAARRRGEP
jgi:hypothetical protein